MIDATDSFFDGFDRTFIDFSSKLAEPFCWGYGMIRYRFVSPLDPNKFDNTTSKIKEIATRIFIFVSAAIAFACAATHVVFSAIVMGVGSKIFRALGFALQKERFTHVCGTAPEKALEKGQASVMTWNIRGEFGGLHYREGGVTHWRSRIDQIIDKIKRENPDVLVLQGIYDTALAETLINRLGQDYAHFFTHMGGSTCDSVNGCMVITKCALHSFTHKEFANYNNFELFELKANPTDELPAVRFVGIQLVPGIENKEKRMEQLTQVVNTLAKASSTLPTLIVGNHADRDCPEEGVFLSQFLHHSYRGEKPTHTNQLALQWNPKFAGPGESFDFISLFKRNIPDGRTLPVIEKDIRLMDCHTVEAFKNYDTKTALSDSHGLITTFSGLRSR